MPPKYMCYYIPKKTFFDRNPTMKPKSIKLENEQEALAEAKHLAEQEGWQGYTLLRFEAVRVYSTLDEEE